MKTHLTYQQNRSQDSLHSRKHRVPPNQHQEAVFLIWRHFSNKLLSVARGQREGDFSAALWSGHTGNLFEFCFNWDCESRISQMWMVRASWLFHLEHTSVSEQGFMHSGALVPCRTVKTIKRYLSHCSQRRKGMIIGRLSCLSEHFHTTKEERQQGDKASQLFDRIWRWGFPSNVPPTPALSYPSSCGKKKSVMWSSYEVPFTALSRVCGFVVLSMSIIQTLSGDVTG